MAKLILFIIKRSKINELLEALEGEEMRPRVERGGPEEVVYVKNAIRQTNFQVCTIRAGQSGHLPGGCCLASSRNTYVLSIQLIENFTLNFSVRVVAF